MKHPALLTLAVVVLVLCGAGTAWAQDTSALSRSSVTATAADSALDAQTTAVALTLRCPVCQGESLQDSPSDLARQMRAVVRDQLRAGKTPEEVKAYFVSRYGEWILLEPTTTGLNILLYVIPVLLVVGGLVLVAFLVRRWSTPEATTR